MLKLVVLNKDATFRLQTSTGLLNLAVLHKDTTLRLLIFLQGVKIAQDGRHSLLLFQCWPLVVRFDRRVRFMPSYSFNMVYFTVMV